MQGQHCVRAMLLWAVACKHRLTRSTGPQMIESASKRQMLAMIGFQFVVASFEWNFTFKISSLARMQNVHAGLLAQYGSGLLAQRRARTHMATSICWTLVQRGCHNFEFAQTVTCCSLFFSSVTSFVSFLRYGQQQQRHKL